MNMNMDYREEILNALGFLKEICKENSFCSKCPLGNDVGDCMIGLTEPYNWDIKTSPDCDVWRAFDD